MEREYAKERRGGGREGQNGRITLEMNGGKEKSGMGTTLLVVAIHVGDRGPRMKMTIMMMTNNACGVAMI